MKFLITGADGLLGNNLVRELLAEGHSVRVLLHPSSQATSLSELPIESVRGDITKDLSAMAEAVKNCDGVFHCAAITDLLAPRDLMYRVNLLGTQNIMEACLKNGVKRLVFVGSASSFQFGSLSSPGNEKGGFAPSYKGVSYMESKHAAMELVQQYIRYKGLDAVIVVPTFMLGSHDTRPSSGELVRQHVMKNMRFTAKGGRNFVHVKDVARGMMLAYETGKCGENYILGHQNLTYSEFFQMVNEALGRKKRQFILPRLAILLAGACAHLVQKFTKTKKMFNFQTARLATLETYYTPEKAVTQLGMPQTPIQIAIQDSLNALKDHGHLL